MPEGHEILRYARRQQQTFGGKIICVESPNGRFADAGVISGRKLICILAMGKHLLYDFGRDRKLHVHLGRFGDFTDGEMPFPEPKGALRLRFSTAKHWLELRGATDISIYDEARVAELRQRLGPDPLDAGSDPAPAYAYIAKARTPIGVLLMDQRVFAGIGNVYRAELLYRASLNPFTGGKDVPAKTVRAMWRDAVKLMPDGMTDRRMVTTRPRDRPHKTGTAQQAETHYVYRRHGKPCWICQAEVRRVDMAGRTLYWCPVCQPDTAGAEKAFLSRAKNRPISRTSDVL